MSFQNKGFWMAQSPGRFPDAEMTFDSPSRIEPKRPHQWFLDDPELFSNKKPAMESPNNRLTSGVPNANVNLVWETPPAFQSVTGHFNDRLFGSVPTRTINFGGSNFQPISTGNLELGRRGIDKHFGNDASIALSMSHTMEDPGSYLSYGGIRKVKVNQVKDSDTGMPVPIGQAFNKGDNSTISFSGFQEAPETNPSRRLISNYDLLLSQSSVEPSETSKAKEAVELNKDIVVSASPLASAPAETPKTKMESKSSKKAPLNNFPSNVRSLLSTAILDGVAVKYVAWSREKELCGVIKGSGYLCSCASCNYSKVLNAYEFERHAGCKTKHPNNHIFFGNGKSIYGIVQELRNTPQKLLFDAIRTVTGSPINEKAFQSWKASFEAATRELQRIYGKDETNKPTHYQGS